MRRNRLIAALVMVILIVTATFGYASNPPAGAQLASGLQWDPQQITLITGDRVYLHMPPDGPAAALVEPADRGGPSPTFRTVARGEDLYVIPNDADRFILEKLDIELFNVTSLYRQGYHDEAMAQVPVIVSYADGGGSQPSQGSVPGSADIPSFTRERTLGSINSAAGHVSKGKAHAFGKALRQAAVAGAGSPGYQGTLFAGVEKIWLDRKVTALLDQSTGQIGAPAVWESGYDGTGLVVAVLDTGVDTTHPDLAGKVLESRNFTDSPTANDKIGHGTHVASIIAGTGAASDGTRKGVAPGAALLSGKVLGDDGTGLLSWVIDGMTWAASSGARVVNMSLGAPATDGTDPLSQALNRLTQETGTLFVVSAGNDGPVSSSVGTPGAADAALTVGAVDRSDALALFSSRGPRLGDYAIKPEITAPGVRIVAARAAGTELGSPEGDHYVALSGTSMAAPHVAGAAAVLAQRYPDWTADELKAALISSASPHPNYSVYQQGGGRVDLARAITQGIYALPAVVNFGVFPFSSAAVVRREVTYRNRSDADVTLTLSLDVRDDWGVPVPGSLVALDRTELTVAAGTSAGAELSLAIAETGSGLYGGYLTASSADGEVVLRTPVGFAKEAEMAELTVRTVGRDGQPVDSWVYVMNVDRAAELYQAVSRDGSAVFRLPKGTYSVSSFIDEVNQDYFPQALSFVSVQELDVRLPMELTLDARQAQLISVTAPDHPDSDAQEVRMAYARQGADGGMVVVHYVMSGELKGKVYAAPTAPVTRGFFEFFTRWQLIEPALRMKVSSPEAFALDPVFLHGSPPVDGSAQYPLVFAGLGRPEDYAGVDAAGKVVLIERDSADPYMLDYDQHVEAAAAAGARMLLVHNSNPGLFWGRAWFQTAIPSATLSQEQGLQLRDLLGRGEVTLEVSGHRTSAYRYDLVLPEPVRVPDSLRYTVDPSTLATLNIGYHSHVPNQLGAEGRTFLRPYEWFALGVTRRLGFPVQRPEYVTAVDTQWFQSVSAHVMPWPVSHQERRTWQSYRPGAVYSQNWWKQPVRPGNAVVGNGGTYIYVMIPTMTDSDGEHYGWMDWNFDRAELRFYQNGQLVGQSPAPFGGFPLSSEPAEYRLEVDAERNAPWWQMSTRTQTAWVIHPEQVGLYEWIPMLFVDLDLPLDVLNRIAAPPDQDGPPMLEMTVRYQELVGGTPDVTGVRLWISYDDGETWREAKSLKKRGRAAYSAPLDLRETGKTTGFVSLRVQASDKAGNQVDQTIIRAYGLPERP